MYNRVTGINSFEYSRGSCWVSFREASELDVHQTFVKERGIERGLGRKTATQFKRFGQACNEFLS